MYHDPNSQTLFSLENRQYGKLTDEEAFGLGMESVGTGERGQDSTHYRLRREWFVNVAYYLGFSQPEYATDHFLDEFDTDRDLTVTPYSANHIGRLVRGEVSRLATARPTWEVSPNNADTRSRQGAKVGQQFLEHYYHKFQMSAYRHDMGLWMATCGMAFPYIGWTPTAGKKTRVYRNPMTEQLIPPGDEMLQDENTLKLLQEYKAFEDLAEGEIELDLCSPFQVRIPIGPTKWEEMPWITITRLRSLDWVWENYPEVAKDIEADENDWSIDGHYWRRLASLVSHSGRDFAVRGASLTEGIEVHEHWRPAYGRFKKGLKVTFTNHRLLENQVHPFYEAGLDLRYPIFPIYYTKIPGRFWGKGMVEDLIGAQEDYNLSAQQTINQRDILSKPQWLASYQSQLSRTRNAAGDIWKFDRQGGAPMLQGPPPIGQAQLATRDHRLYDMQTMAAQSEASLGQNPTGVDSGAQLQRLQERDLMTIGPTIGSIETGFTWMGETLLKLTHAFVKVPQMVQIIGGAAQADVMFFKGADLQGQTAVRVLQGSMRPQSKAASQEALLQLLQLGALDPASPEVQRHILETFEIGGLERMFLLIDAHRRRANIENQMFLEPDSANPEFAYPDVDELDDHRQHLEEHLAFAATDDYEMLPIMAKQAFLAHVSAHQMAIAQMVQTQMMLAGGAAGPGGGSPPRETGTPSTPKQSNPTPGSQSPTGAA